MFSDVLANIKPTLISHLKVEKKKKIMHTEKRPLLYIFLLNLCSNYPLYSFKCEGAFYSPIYQPWSTIRCARDDLMSKVFTNMV